MHVVSEESTIVIVGDWNIAIFTPDWISGRLTESQEIEVQIPIGSLGQPPRLGFDALFLRVLPDRLVLAPKDDRSGALAQLERVSTKVLEDLDHTPVRAVGVNFCFLEENPTEQLLGAFRLADQDYLSDQGAALETTTIKRKLIIQEKILNLTVERGNRGSVTILMNFHKNVTSSLEAADFLRGATEGLRVLAATLIEHAYGHTVE